jgi:glycosyltransferase involved in cell wall biosynthesis
MKPLAIALLPRPPHPTRDGGAIRMRHLLGGLAEEFRVRALVLKPPYAPDADYPDGVEAREILHEVTGGRRAAAALAGLVGGRPYSERLYRSARLETRLAEAVAAERPTWVVAFMYHLGPAAIRAGAPVWIDFQNRDSEIWARMGQTASSPGVRLFARLQAPRVAALEKRLAAGAAGISCVSARDAKGLETLAARTKALIVPNGVDLSRYRFRPEPATEEVLFFVGDLSWPPNAEGVRWFRDRAWPLVKARRPSARVEILGRGAPPALTAGAGDDFRFLGEGDDTRPHWERASVAIVPLLAGGGTRLKILEAAACGVPVVSTPVGAEGLQFAPGSEILLAAEPESFAEATATLLADREARRRLAEAARKRVEAQYDWAPIAAAFGRELAARSMAR